MIISCGIDIEEINRFDKHYFQNGILSDLIYDVFTTREIDSFAYFGKKAFLKGFCFKESFYKAINCQNISWFDIEIFFTENGYQIKTSTLLKNELIKIKADRIEVQFSESDKFIICTVLLIK